MSFHTDSAEAVLTQFGTGPEGLSARQVEESRAIFGENRLPEAKPLPAWRLWWHQFESPLIFILLLAALVVFFLGEYADASVIVAVLLVNALIGVVQEGRAENALRALNRLVETRARVLRDGRELSLSDAELVPGDILLLEDGDRVPADARLLAATNLLVDESALTGESEAVLKDAGALAAANAIPAEQRNMIFRGSLVVGGAARALVVATGVLTVIGKISVKLEKLDAEMPLHATIRRLSRLIIVTVFSLGAILFAIGTAYGHPAREMFALVVALAVSAIPEGLPIVVTLVLATGVSRMVRRQVLVRRLQAVEALGQAKVIAVDKTGTVTKNQMMVSRVFVGDRFFDVSGSGYDPAGELRENGVVVEGLPELALVARVAALTASATVALEEPEGEWRRMSGDPTEAALLVFARKLGFMKEELVEAMPLEAEIRFDSRHKYHACLNLSSRKHDVKSALLSVVGAPEVVLARCQSLWRGGKNTRLKREDRARLETVLGTLAADGLRVLALAQNSRAPRALASDALPPLTFVGFVGIADALRSEVAEAVASAQAAGIRVVMITGDHEDTARLIARRAGIFQAGEVVLSGREIEAMSAEELAARLDKATVFARVTPEHKLKIIEAYKARGEIVAMTGDGVNDALSLAAADLGVAMGKIGTEVAKQSADLILLDDNFGNIVKAVEEGRNIYATIKKVVLYLFSTSAGEILTIAGAILLGFSVPLNASQIIWLNFVTDGFLVAALAFEPKEKHLLRERFAGGLLVDRLAAFRIFLMGAVMMVGALWLFNRFSVADFARASTLALSVLAVFQWFNAWNCRSDRASIFRPGVRLNRPLVLATAAVVLLQLAAVYLGPLQKVLGTVPLALSDWALVIGTALLIVIVEETRKFITRSRRLWTAVL
jgi:Ca2+-transporting ATPase